MRICWKPNLLVTLASVFLTLASGANQNPDAAGYWQGAIDLPQGELKISVHLEEEGGAWKGTIDIPVQGLRNFALSNVRVEGSSVHFEMAGIPGDPAFDGQLAAARDKVGGTFTQGPNTLDFHLERSEAPSPEEAGPSLPSQPVPGEGAVGEWLGTLDLGPAQPRMYLKVESGDDGGLTAVFKSVEEGRSLPVDQVTLEEGRLNFSIAAIRATYSGKMVEDGSLLEGEWSQGGRTLALDLHRMAAAD